MSLRSSLLLLTSLLSLPLSSALMPEALDVEPLPAVASPGGARREAPDFASEIQPLLVENCFQCHGPDPSSRRARLRLDLPAGLFGDRGGYAPIVPGDVEGSEVLFRVRSLDEDLRMPPPEAGPPLEPEQIERLERWVEAGAPYAGHWAYEPIAVERGLADEHPVDAYLEAAWEREGLEPAPLADRATLARRLHFDLLGLPPDAARVAAFEDDPRPDAYERLVDELLASPHFGERLASMWLDLVRYADSTGYHGDNEREVWLYRDWVVEAFNSNVPFDRFTIEQLAGDLLEEPTDAQRIASTYNRLNLTTFEFGANDAEYRAKSAADRVRTTGSAWLGSTLGCAQCHDHKFDPFSTEEFYRFAAFFADIDEPAVGLPTPMYLPDPAQRAAWQELQQAREGLRAELTQRSPEREALLAAWEREQRPRLDRPTTAMTEWRVAGPYSAGTAQQAFDDAHPPEAAYRDSDVAAEDLFRPLESDPGALVPLPGSGAANYVAAKLEAPEANPFELTIVSRSGLRVWLNDELLLAREPDRMQAPVTLRLRLPLRAGSNELLIKSVQAFGDDLIGVSGCDHGLTPELRAVFALPAPERSERDLQTLREHHQRLAPEFEPLRTAIAELDGRIAALRAEVPTCLTTRSGPPRETRVLPRGDWLDRSGERVQPGVPATLPPLESEGDATRLDLARWLVRPDQPLTARVTVNRIWALLFGKGLHEPLDDFGVRGSYPTHGALLDELAARFVAGGWDLKQLVRTLATSRAYRSASAGPAQLAQLDPNNEHFARATRWRLPAEHVRDASLAISGLLEPALGGPPVRPSQPDGIWSGLNFPPREYLPDPAPQALRRGLYVHWQRTALHPALFAFDAPTREYSVSQRESSNTPLQALVLLNDPNFVQAARAFAARIVEEGGDNDPAKLAWAWRTALSHEPRAAELEVLTGLLRAGRAEGEDPAWLDVARCLLNLGETYTRP